MVFFNCNLIRNDNDSTSCGEVNAFGRGMTAAFRHVHGVLLSFTTVLFSPYDSYNE